MFYSDSLIVYRSPLEQWWWESGAVYWLWGSIIGACLLFYAYAFVLAWRDSWKASKPKPKPPETWMRKP